MLNAMPGMITCREFEAFVVDYVDGSLSKEQIKLFERHLKFCSECRRYLDAYVLSNELSSALRVDPDMPVSGDIPKELVEAVLASKALDE